MCGLDFESVAEAGSLLGTGAVMVMDETDCVVEAAERMVEFYAHESCGKCTPCREGTLVGDRVLGRIEDGYGREEDMPLHARGRARTSCSARSARSPTAPCPRSQSTLQALQATSTRQHVELGRCPLSARPVARRGGGVVTPEPRVTLTIDGKEVTVP